MSSVEARARGLTAHQSNDYLKRSMDYLSLIVKENVKSRTADKVFGVILVLLGVGCSLGYGLSAEGEGDKDKPILVGMLLCLSAVGIPGLVRGFRRPESDPGIELLTKTPERIVWAHTTEEQRGGLVVRRLVVLHSDAGKRFELTVPLLVDEKLATEFLAKTAPRATLGYDPSYLERFEKDPTSLRAAA